MNDDTTQDLKQFIAATISQQTSDIVACVNKTEERVDKVDQKIDELSQSVVEALENTNDSTDSQLQDHGKRITRLEQKAT